MSVAPIQWRLPGCGVDCRPHRHDPAAHEAHGFRLALLLTTWTPPPAIVRTGPLVVDLDAQRVTVDGQLVHLTGREWGILTYLATRAGQDCPIDDIVVAIWGPEWVNPTLRKGRSTERADHAYLRTLTGRLRTKLGPAGRLIVSPYRVRREASHAVAGLRLEVEP